MLKVKILLSFVFLLATSVTFASNIGRSFYGVYAESLTGVDFSDDVNDNTVRLYKWGNFSTSDGKDNPKEGLKYLICSASNSSWGGGGITFADSSDSVQRDMSAYYGGELRFSVRVGSNYTNFPIGIKVNGIEACVPLNSGKFSGFDSSKLNQWQEVSLKLDSTTRDEITSKNMEKTSYLFLITYDPNVVSAGNIEVDYVRWVKPNATGNFEVTVKNVNGNSSVNTSTISFSSGLFRKSWSVAEQYLEVDFDDDSKKNWNVKLYVNNGSSTRNGLCATTNKDIVLPMCWRASEKVLPYSDSNGAHTTQIAEGYNTKEKYYYLYDSGSSSTEYSPWLYMQDLAKIQNPPREYDEEGKEIPYETVVKPKTEDYSTLMGYKTGGYHAYSGVYGGSASENGYYSGSKVNVYFGINCTNAFGGLIYTGDICVVLSYE